MAFEKKLTFEEALATFVDAQMEIVRLRERINETVNSLKTYQRRAGTYLVHTKSNGAWAVTINANSAVTSYYKLEYPT